MTTPDDRTFDPDDTDDTNDTENNRSQQTTTTAIDERSVDDERLVDDESAVDYRTRWEVVQQGFVDNPRNAVSEADKLVDEVLEQLATGFDRQHQNLEQQWSDGEPSTEDLRSALQRYRAFFQRLLTI